MAMSVDDLRRYAKIVKDKIATYAKDPFFEDCKTHIELAYDKLREQYPADAIPGRDNILASGTWAIRLLENMPISYWPAVKSPSMAIFLITRLILKGKSPGSKTVGVSPKADAIPFSAFDDETATRDVVRLAQQLVRKEKGRKITISMLVELAFVRHMCDIDYSKVMMAYSRDEAAAAKGQAEKARLDEMIARYRAFGANAFFQAEQVS